MTVFKMGSPLLRLNKKFCLFVKRNLTTSEVVIENDGTGELSWKSGEVSYGRGDGWLTVDDSGTVAAGGKLKVTLTVNRTGLKPGPYMAIVPIESNGGQGTISVIMRVPLLKR